MLHPMELVNYSWVVQRPGKGGTGTGRGLTGSEDNGEWSEMGSMDLMHQKTLENKPLRSEDVQYVTGEE